METLVGATPLRMTGWIFETCLSAIYATSTYGAIRAQSASTYKPGLSDLVDHSWLSANAKTMLEIEELVSIQ